MSLFCWGMKPASDWMQTNCIQLLGFAGFVPFCTKCSYLVIRHGQILFLKVGWNWRGGNMQRKQFWLACMRMGFSELSVFFRVCSFLTRIIPILSYSKKFAHMDPMPPSPYCPLYTNTVHFSTPNSNEWKKTKTLLRQLNYFWDYYFPFFMFCIKPLCRYNGWSTQKGFVLGLASICGCSGDLNVLWAFCP